MMAKETVANPAGQEDTKLVESERLDFALKSFERVKQWLAQDPEFQRKCPHNLDYEGEVFIAKQVHLTDGGRDLLATLSRLDLHDVVVISRVSDGPGFADTTYENVYIGVSYDPKLVEGSDIERGPAVSGRFCHDLVCLSTVVSYSSTQDSHSGRQRILDFLERNLPTMSAENQPTDQS